MKRTLNIELNKLVAQDKQMREASATEMSPLRKRLTAVHNIPDEWKNDLGGYVDALARRESYPDGYTKEFLLSILLPETVEGQNQPESIALVKRLNEALLNEQETPDYNPNLTGDEPAADTAPSTGAAAPTGPSEAERIEALEKENAELRQKLEQPAASTETTATTATPSNSL